MLTRLQRERVESLTSEIDRLGGEQCNADRVAELAEERKQLNHLKRRTMITVALEQPREVRLLPRGNWLDDSGPVMQPAVPEFLGKLSKEGRANRLDLANWLVDPKAGAGLLTARVMANRLWFLMFGAGLSESLEDFGGQGQPPEHPELLDNLAIEFVESGWDIKHLIKLMVMSQTWRQSSVASERLRSVDPENQLFARQSRYRLPAEMIRDSALLAGGILVDELGGASVKPYQPLGYYRHLNFPQRRYAHHGDQRQWRRGVYVHWQRQYLHPMLKAFDAPTREECTAKRSRSNTPLAALVLLNDPTFVEAARGLAHRLLAKEANDVERLQSAFLIVLSRAPTDKEIRLLSNLLAVSRSEFKSSPDAAHATNDVGEKRHTTNDPSELAAWTTVTRAVLNLSEANTRQ